MSGECWAGMLIYDTIFLSVHLLDHCEEEGRGDQTVKEVISFVSHLKGKFRSKELKVVLGIDANCTLSPDVEGVTGPRVGHRIRSHSRGMRNMVMSLFGALEVRALNTYLPEGEINLDIQDTWTCGTRRPLQKRTQIDYVAGSDL
eukprot:3757051-Karenia_brevis.AAC.1